MSRLPSSLAVARPLAAACLAACLATQALAQSVVGKALVEGRTVTLYDDHSWAFSDASGSCAAIAVGLDFCGADAGWKDSRKPTPDYAAAYRLTDRIYGGLIIEDVGMAQGLNVEAVRSLILDIGANGTGATPTLLDTLPVTVGEETGETMVYAFTIQGVDVVYANSFVLGENRTLQLLTYEIGKTWTDAHREAHAGFVAATRYKAD